MDNSPLDISCLWCLLFSPVCSWFPLVIPLVWVEVLDICMPNYLLNDHFKHRMYLSPDDFISWHSYSWFLDLHISTGTTKYTAITQVVNM